VRNFAESLAYWYLRLNGFFPLVDFVHHEAGAQHGDTDVIAVRLPHMVEKIGDETVSFDSEWHDTFKFDFGRDTIGVIAEVKGGRQAEPNAHYPDRLPRAVARMGIFDDADMRRVKELETTAIWRPSDGRAAIKLLFRNDTPSEIPYWKSLSLTHAECFIRSRLRDYALKHSGWHLFPDDLMQYLTWKARQEAH
jgi:hypothetical protein